MSSIYNLEPQPTASAIIHTTGGDLSVELWAKQTPLTCRNFLQLALDGYYDNTIFHRLVPGFILQGGDPTGTGNGGESIYDGGAFSDELDPWPMDQRHGPNAGPTGVGFKDEVHSRLKFNRRGLLGMANESKPNTNGSQFFFTLDKTNELTGKNTLFGRIAGDTIYNLAKMGEGELNAGTERPIYPVKITNIEILVNPFEDMRKRVRVAPQVQKVVVVERKKKRKGGKQLLSFGDDEGDVEPSPKFKKAKFDTRIALDTGGSDPAKSEEETKERRKRKKVQTIDEEEKNQRPDADRDGQEAAAVTRTNETLEPAEVAPRENESQRRQEPRDSNSPEHEAPARKTALDKTNEEIAALKAAMRRKTEEEVPEQSTRKKSALENMIPETSIRGRKRRTGGGSSAPSREDQKALNFLKAFRSKLDSAPDSKETVPKTNDEAREESEGPVAKGAEDGDARLCDLHFIAGCESCKAWDQAEDGNASDDEGWMSHALSFKADKLGKDLSYRKKAEEELVVIDPREKARTLKEEKKAQREAKSGNTGREWDQQRNSQMARAAAVAGRGAK